MKKTYAVALFYMNTSMVTSTMESIKTNHHGATVFAETEEEALGRAITQYSKQHEGQLLYSHIVWEVPEKPKD